MEPNTYEESRKYLQPKREQFNNKYKTNKCQIHNQYFEQHDDCYGTYCDYWYKYQINDNCNSLCKECVREYLDLISIEWKNSILLNLSDCEKHKFNYFKQ